MTDALPIDRRLLAANQFFCMHRSVSDIAFVLTVVTIAEATMASARTNGAKPCRPQ
ncbi:hypothetical protein [Mesorhizobium captivum]|uniref:hypothetical protein n=1 Tax=Mesorhizobium captivum TaxID=3072319 RepID=UPI002A2446AA|nr:hypothetical protein [Mesorhizobium sp. VK3C]MDX8446429.1 hypothetical protein [Mesorhizobium sp. VK3C]